MNENIHNIKTKEDFLNFLDRYIQSFREEKESWENSSIDTFLEGMHGWVDDMEGYYENMGLPIPEHIDWKIFADILYASKMYE
ncbi:DUF7660 family protein [Aquimarina algicola]|uniref:DUF7660 domain-containing protein n=1 Tax=Aquimarina algicola TaxID=2589995 RepID=A0A504JLK0_9FLAO|nr:hypothetical protein [Aquimarina algicola]TPN87380.1 hypothetical protein FHK87_07280 [Aquimarina algicola]